MTGCYEHDYEAVFCRNCGGYCGMACTDCGSMTDGGEQTYVTMEWCRCNKQVFDFGFEEPDEGKGICANCSANDWTTAGFPVANDYCKNCGAIRA